MSICIAALYDSGKGALLVSDTRITRINRITHEFHQVDKDTSPKMKKINQNCWLMTAGELDISDDILENLVKLLKTQDDVKVVAQKLTQAFTKVRLALAVIDILHCRGFTEFESYRDFCTKRETIDYKLFLSFDAMIAGYELDVHYILVGKAKDDKFYIYQIHDPGKFKKRHEGFAAIGETDKEDEDTIALSYMDKHYKGGAKAVVKEFLLEAKKLSERYPGVGPVSHLVDLPSGAEEIING